MSKQDRILRMLNVFVLICQNPGGIKVTDVARRFGVSTRTVRRDCKALGKRDYLNIPVWVEDGKCRINENYLLPRIPFTLNEAITVFLSARLMLKYANRYDPAIASTFFKLNAVVPPPLRDHIQKTMDWMQTRQDDRKYQRILRELFEAWTTGQTVEILYQSLGDEKPSRRSIDPYFIEPAAAGHASYIIARCHRANEIRTFKIERISSVVPTLQTYKIPSDFDADVRLSAAWGIVTHGEAVTVRLKFDKEVAKIAEETIYHPSQVVERQADGSALMTLNVMNTVELMGWILGWGAMVEVLEPEELRQEVAETAQAMLDIYK